MTRARRSTSDESWRDDDMGQTIVVVARGKRVSTGIQTGNALLTAHETAHAPPNPGQPRPPTPVSPIRFKFPEKKRRGATYKRTEAKAPAFAIYRARRGL
jgi:hypothetical protein